MASMASAVKRKPRKSNANTTISIDNEDGTQADRPKRKGPTRRKGGVTKRLQAHSYAECNEDCLKEFVKSACELGVKGIMDEFAAIRAETQTCTKAKAAHEKNAERNRYKDVYCIDDTRVVLKYPEGEPQDYIHANWVKSCGDANKFICTQGPTEKTIEDFWRMIIQEKPPCVVMLCNTIEMGKKKCEQYWPETADKPMTFGKLTVKLLEAGREVESNILLKRISVTDDKAISHTVDHWHWKAWPDRGVPEIPMATFRLLLRLKSQSPILVHCSAGIGRTGTIVGLDIAYAKLCQGEKISLKEIVKDIRAQRHGSVQTDAQYLFMHRVLLALAENKKITVPEMAPFVTEYDKTMSTKAG